MKCDTACKSFNSFDISENKGSGVGGGPRFRDEREYLAFLLEQERVWEDEHLGKASPAPEETNR
jgi:hypothetical protein